MKKILLLASFNLKPKDVSFDCLPVQLCSVTTFAGKYMGRCQPSGVCDGISEASDDCNTFQASTMCCIEPNCHVK